jgi:hypothetical protein
VIARDCAGCGFESCEINCNEHSLFTSFLDNVDVFGRNVILFFVSSHHFEFQILFGVVSHVRDRV